MVNWRALGVGLTIGFFAGVAAMFYPVAGHVVSGLGGGFAAGYLSCRHLQGRPSMNAVRRMRACGVPKGILYGTVVGLVGGALLTATYLVLGSAFQTVDTAVVSGPFASASVPLVALAILVVSLVAGAAGGGAGAAAS